MMPMNELCCFLGKDMPVAAGPTCGYAICEKNEHEAKRVP